MKAKRIKRRKPEAARKTAAVTVKITANELSRLQARAGAHNLSVAEFVRTILDK